MVYLSRIYIKTGDQGDMGLGLLVVDSGMPIPACATAGGKRRAADPWVQQDSRRDAYNDGSCADVPRLFIYPATKVSPQRGHLTFLPTTLAGTWTFLWQPLH
jgi:hypothetical protein